MRLVIAMVLGVLNIALAQAAHAAVPPQTIMKGQSTTIAVDYEIGDVAAGDPAVCDFLVAADRRSLYLNARGGGETTVTLWDAQGGKRDEVPVRVVTTSLKEALERARDAVGGLKGVDVEVRNGRVEVAGEVAEPEDFRQIEAMSRADPRVRSRVRLARDVIGTVADAVREAVGVPGVRVRAVRDRVVLEGVVYSAADAKRAAEIARLYTPDVLDLLEVKESGRSVGQGKLIELEFHLMEIKKSALRELGVSWAPGSFPQSGGGNVGAGGGGLLASAADLGRQALGFVMNLLPRLKLIRERGDGRVLEHPSVIVKSGEEAKFFSGSEVPYLKGDKGEEVQFKKVGVEIAATPIEVAGGIDLKLTATLSAPSADIRGAVDTHTVATTAICPLGQSMVLGGIVSNGDVKMKNRAPRDADQSTALVTLFASKDFQSNRSEFLLIVTPRLVEQPSPAEAQLRAFLATEEAMIKDRSRKEFAAEAAKRGESIEEVPPPRPAKPARRGKWR